MAWIKIETVPPPSDLKPILCCFKGQFNWVYFICDAFGKETHKQGYAKPTYWQPIEECLEE